MMPRQIDQRPPNLRSGQAEELADRRRPHVAQRPIQPQHGTLKHIVGLLPPSQVRITAKHATSERQQPLTRVIEQQIARGTVTGRPAIEQPLHLGRLAAVVHPTVRRSGNQILVKGVLPSLPY